MNPPTNSRVVTRPMYWSILREVWENRSVYIAPLVVAGFVLFGFLISMFRLPRRMRGLPALDPARQQEILLMPYHAIAGALIVTGFVVGAFYCLDALNGERRDRSILFWKSLPVSDRTTVLSKASIPLLIIPLLSFTIVVAVQRVMLLLSTLVLSGSGESVKALWSQLPLLQMAVSVLYGLAAIALWHAPIYAWLLLVSAWARRAAILWALLPPLAIAALERMAFGTTHFMTMLGYRMTGWFRSGFVMVSRGRAVPTEPLDHLTPGRYLSSPDLWLGLAFAVAFLALAVRLRRNREPN
jgi:ABC-2 type transport system permease protein